MKAIIFSNSISSLKSVYSPLAMSKMDSVADLDRTFFTKNDIIANPENFSDVEFIFSTWGMPVFSEEEIKKYFPKLRCLFYAAGSVQKFARPFLNCGVKVFSAWAANGLSVAEFTVAQIILANKGFYTLSSLLKKKRFDDVNRLKFAFPGNVGEKIGLIGCGMIGTQVAELLQQYELEVLVFDPFLSDERAQKLNVRKCSLEEIFSTCSVISNHLANNPQTRHMLRYEHFSAMRPFSTFINTGRGAQVIEDDLVKALTEKPDIVAVLDVTDPEPAVPTHPFYDLENCFIAPHIAGSLASAEHSRMVQYMVSEYNSYVSGNPLKYEVTMRMLETMA